MSDETEAHGFSEFHQRHVRTTFQYIDKLLSKVPPSEPHSGAVWAAAINLMFCSISLNELTPERMRCRLEIARYSR
jgi:hypothetical protein